MLVIISDLHLTDGSSGSTIREGAFRVLRQRLRDLIYDASWRGKDDFRPIEEMHLVLLGDVLDVIRSNRWLLDGNEARPWSDAASPGFLSTVQQISDGILAHNRESLAVLRSLKEGSLSIANPEAKGERLPVRVHTYYMVGNHDWFYHLPGEALRPMRAAVVEAIGLENDPDEPFPHDPAEPGATAEAIRGIFERHQVFARHGDLYDPFNYEPENGRDHSSLGDAIVVELLNRFPQRVEDELGDVLPRETVLGFREIDNVRPYLVIPGWLNGLLARTVPDPKISQRIKKIWDSLADDFLKVDFVRAHDRWGWDIIDKLQAGLKIAGGFSFAKIGDLALKAYQRLGGAEGSFYPNALNEKAYQNGSARFVVYGHTHHHEVVPLAVRSLGDRVVRQLYINSGTWRRVHEIVRHDLESLQFYDFNVMTYLAFFHGDERRGRPFDSWSGTLGVPAGTARA